MAVHAKNQEGRGFLGSRDLLRGYGRLEKLLHLQGLGHRCLKLILTKNVVVVFSL